MEEGFTEYSVLENFNYLYNKTEKVIEEVEELLWETEPWESLECLHYKEAITHLYMASQALYRRIKWEGEK